MLHRPWLNRGPRAITSDSERGELLLETSERKSLTDRRRDRTPVWRDR
jgi:hypothetical protein